MPPVRWQRRMPRLLLPRFAGQRGRQGYLVRTRRIRLSPHYRPSGLHPFPATSQMDLRLQRHHRLPQPPPAKSPDGHPARHYAHQRHRQEHAGGTRDHPLGRSDRKSTLLRNRAPSAVTDYSIFRNFNRRQSLHALLPHRLTLRHRHRRQGAAHRRSGRIPLPHRPNDAQPEAKRQTVACQSFVGRALE